MPSATTWRILSRRPGRCRNRNLIFVTAAALQLEYSAQPCSTQPHQSHTVEWLNLRVASANSFIEFDDLFGAANSLTNNPFVEYGPIDFAGLRVGDEQRLLKRLGLVPRSGSDKPIHYRMRRRNYSDANQPRVDQFAVRRIYVCATKAQRCWRKFQIPGGMRRLEY